MSALDAGQHLVELRLRDQRSELGRGLQRISDAQCLHAFDEGVAEFIVDAAFDEQP